MAYKSQTEKTMKEIKKELKPFVDIFKSIDKYSRIQKRNKIKKEIYKQYQKEQREIRFQKLENNINWLTDKINEHNKKKNFDNNKINTNDNYSNLEKTSIKNGYYCDKCGNEVSKDSIKCNNCNAQFIDERIPTTFMCSNCHNLIKESKKCPRCGAWFVDSNMDDDKKNLLKKLDQNVRKDNWQKLTKEELADEIKNIIIIMNNNYKDVKKYVSKKSNEFEVKSFISYQNKIDNLNKKVNNIEQNIEKGLNKSDSLKEYSKLIEIYSQSIKLHKGMIGGILAELKATGFEIRSKNASIVSGHEEKEIINNEDYSQLSNNIEYEEKNNNVMDNDIVYRELEDWQKREVDENDYDSYNFEEEELEDDDYYYEDDKE